MRNTEKIVAFNELLSSFNLRKVSFKFNILDKNDNFKFTLKSVKKANIVYNKEQKIKSSFNFEIEENAETEKINFLTDRIKPITVIDETEFPQGIFLLNSSIRKLNSTEIVNRPVVCYDKLQILAENKVDSRYYIPAGVKYIEVIKNIITGSTNSLKVDIEDSPIVLNTDKEYEIGTSKLKIVNDLLKEINYTELDTNEEGYLVSKNYELPSLRTIDFQYKADKQSIIDVEIEEELDLFNIPNKFVRYIDNPETENLVSIYNNDSIDNILSTVNRGRIIVDVKKVDDIASQQVLDAYTKREAYNLSNPYGYISFKSAIMPVHWGGNILYLDIPQMDVKDKYEEIEWSYDFIAGGLMNHKVRKVVNI